MRICDGRLIGMMLVRYGMSSIEMSILFFFDRDWTPTYILIATSNDPHTLPLQLSLSILYAFPPS